MYIMAMHQIIGKLKERGKPKTFSFEAESASLPLCMLN